MKIKPQITEGDNVKLEIENELSSFDTPQRSELQAPAKVVRKVKTAVLTSDGQTVVLGGLMEDQARAQKSKIPLLGDIPLLGFLFRKTDMSKSKSNLLIFLTPYVVHDTGDFLSILKRKVDQRNSFFDKNLTRKQRKTAREMIKDHRADLLEVRMYPGEPIPRGQIPGQVTPVPVKKPPPPEDIDLAY